MAKPVSKIADRRAAAQDDATAGYTDRRHEIVAAAVQVFKEHGLRSATYGHIAERLGTDRASLYYYFSNKEEIFQEAVREAVGVNIGFARETAASDAPAPEKLRRLMEGLMASYGETYPVLYVLIQENLTHVKPQHRRWANSIKKVNREYEQILIGIVQEGQDAGTLRATSPAWVVAYGIMGMLGWTSRWFDPTRSGADAAQIGSTFADIVLDGLTT